MVSKNTKLSFSIVLVMLFTCFSFFILLWKLDPLKRESSLLRSQLTLQTQLKSTESTAVCGSVGYYADLIKASMNDSTEMVLISVQNGSSPYIWWKNAISSPFSRHNGKIVVETGFIKSSVTKVNEEYLSSLESKLIASGFSKNSLNTVISIPKQSYRYGYEKGNVKLVVEFHEDIKVPHSQSFTLFCGVINY